MNRTIITHVGASVLSCDALTRYASFALEDLRSDLRRELVRTDYLESCTRDLIRGLSDTWNCRQHLSLQNRRYESPAEIAALSALEVNNAKRPADQIVLLHSDTKTGEFCAHLLQASLTSSRIPSTCGYPYVLNERIVAQPIKGLRITDDFIADIDLLNSSQFSASLGIQGYVQQVLDKYRALSAEVDELIFNLTSGYRGLLPVTHTLATLLAANPSSQAANLAISMCSLYQGHYRYQRDQGSSELIWHPLLPVTFDWAAVPRDLLREAGETAGIAEATVPAKHRYLFEPLTGQIQRMGRSTTGEIVWGLLEGLE